MNEMADLKFDLDQCLERCLHLNWMLVRFSIIRSEKAGVGRKCRGDCELLQQPRVSPLL